MNDTNKCTGCIGEDTCMKYCERHTARALIELLMQSTYVDTNFGGLCKSNDKGEYDLTVIGHEVVGDSIGKILKKNIDCSVKIRDVFKTVHGKPAWRIIDCLANSEREKDICKIASEKIKAFNQGKCVAVPFKCGTPMQGKFTDGRVEDCEVAAVLWKVDTETQEITMFIKVKCKYTGSFFIKPISEYGSSIWVRNDVAGLSTKSKEIKTSEIIKFNSAGFIKTIEFKADDTSLIVDSRYIYLKEEDNVSIVGAWDGTRVVPSLRLQEISWWNLVKKLEECLSIIKVHRRYIIPYGLNDTNIIEI